MTNEHARDILRLQLITAITDGNKMDWRKKNYIEALQAGIEALTVCIVQEQSKVAAADFEKTASTLECPHEYVKKVIDSLNGQENKTEDEK